MAVGWPRREGVRRAKLPTKCLSSAFRAFVFLFVSGCLCSGSMLSRVLVSHLFSVLLLVFFFPLISAVQCTSCYDDPSNGASHDTANCPWVTGIAANLTALAATATTVLGIEKLLPIKLVRVFPRAILGTLKSLATRSTDGTSLTLSDSTTASQMVAAIGCNRLTKEQAHEHLTSRIEAINPDDTHAAIKLKKIEAMMQAVSNASARVSPDSTINGRFTYVLARLSGVVCSKVAQKFELMLETCTECDGPPSSSSPSSSSSSSGQSKIAATLVRPTSFAQMACLLNHFCLVIIATGAASPLALLPFLDEVVWEPLRLNLITWPVAFETLLIYLVMLEDSSTYHLSSIVVHSGGIDSKRDEASRMAQGLYPAACFRSGGGEPRATGTSPRAGTGPDDKYVGDVSGNATATKLCVAYNQGIPHLNKHVGADGVCLFKHACSQFVLDKGPGGKCLGDHPRVSCNYDASKKCKQPVK